MSASKSRTLSSKSDREWSTRRRVPLVLGIVTAIVCLSSCSPGVDSSLSTLPVKYPKPVVPCQLLDQQVMTSLAGESAPQNHRVDPVSDLGGVDDERSGSCDVRLSGFGASNPADFEGKIVNFDIAVTQLLPSSGQIAPDVAHRHFVMPDADGHETDSSPLNPGVGEESLIFYEHSARAYNGKFRDGNVIVRVRLFMSPVGAEEAHGPLSDGDQRAEALLKAAHERLVASR